MYEAMKDISPPHAKRMLDLNNYDINAVGDAPSKVCTALLSNEEYLTAKIQKVISDARKTMPKYNFQIDEEKTINSMRDLFKFVANNPGGIQVKLLDETIRSGVYVIPATTDEVEQAKIRTFQSLSEEIMGDSFKQRLVGIEPSSPEGEELLLEIAYWIVGFSGTCTSAIKDAASNPELMTTLIQTSMNTILRESVTIEPPLFYILRDTLEDNLLNNRMMVIQMGMKSWENPQVNQYAASNLGRFDKDTLISSMESLLAFMKANSGFRTT